LDRKITVCLTFDFDAESVQVREREEQGRISKGQFAVNRGIPRILSFLEKHKITGTFFTCGWVADEYPNSVKKIVDQGHEIAGHGYLHEYLDKLSLNEEKAVFKRMINSLSPFCDNIFGFRAPYWQLSQNTLDLVAKAGYIYDSSLFSDDRPYILQNLDIVEFPVEWFLDDWVVFEINQLSPTSVLDIWKNQFDAFSRSKDIPEEFRVFTLTCHPAAIGHAYRMEVLEKLVNYIKTKNVKFEMMNQVAKRISGKL
jgi:peptidoglycan/xylan/chitin deacetylase (PgdA/CDA1 family)